MIVKLSASSILLLGSIIACSLPARTVQEPDNFYDEKVSELGVDVQLNCTSSAQYPSAPNDSVPVSWMLPNLTVLYDNEGRFQIANDKWTLKINDVGTDDLGLYHCMLKTPEMDWYIIRIGLNAGGPYFEDLWDKYWLNTVIGLSAFFGFLLLTLSAYLIYHFRYQEPEDSQSSTPSKPIELPSYNGDVFNITRF